MRESRAAIGAAQFSGCESTQKALAIEAAGQIANPTLSRLYAYWDAKRGDRRFPGRSDLDPLDIPTLLSSIFLVAVRRSPFDLVFRLAGTVLTDCYGGAVTGTRLSEVASTGATDLHREAARTVEGGGPVLISGPLRTRADDYRRADHLLLPLGESPHQVDMLIGAAIFRTYPVGERPGRSPDTPTWETRIRAVDTMQRFQAPRTTSGPDSDEALTDHKITSA